MTFTGVGFPDIEFGLPKIDLDLFGTRAKREKEEKKNEPLNQLYRQGYGFDNPNVERLKNKQPPLNLDGTVD